MPLGMAHPPKLVCFACLSSTSKDDVVRYGKSLAFHSILTALTAALVYREALHGKAIAMGDALDQSEAGQVFAIHEICWTLITGAGTNNKDNLWRLAWTAHASFAVPFRTCAAREEHCSRPGYQYCHI